jgi:ABC-type microcin C transport system permease subunit YejB
MPLVCGKEMKRVPDVVTVGLIQATIAYLVSIIIPLKMKQPIKINSQLTLLLKALIKRRGWFYSLLVLVPF